MRTSAHSGSSGWASDLPDPRDTAKEGIGVGLKGWDTTGSDELGIDVDVGMGHVGGNADGVDEVGVESASNWGSITMSVLDEDIGGCSRSRIVGKAGMGSSRTGPSICTTCCSTTAA